MAQTVAVLFWMALFFGALILGAGSLPESFIGWVVAIGISVLATIVLFFVKILSRK
jgi:hypothetical protein